MTRVKVTIGWATLMLVTAVLPGPIPASALTFVMQPVLTSNTTITVALSPGEPTATVCLTDGGVPIGRAVTTDGIAVFGGVTMTPGPHKLRASGSDQDPVSAVETSTYVWGEPAPPRWLVAAGAKVISPASVSVQAGASTATMTLSLNGRRVKAVPCVPGRRVIWGHLRLRKGDNRLTVESESRDGSRTVHTRMVERYEFPYSTCIFIDKSQYRLYWVKGQQLVKIYRIAHGRHNWTPVGVWKVLAKYKPDPKGIYGPRKMRMFRRIGGPGHYRYVFTRYGIHGTNEPWVIGTQASHGCIRMYNRDVLELWPQVPLGTYVVTRE